MLRKTFLDTDYEEFTSHTCEKEGPYSKIKLICLLESILHESPGTSSLPVFPEDPRFQKLGQS